MRSRFRTMGMLRAMREKLGRFSRVLAEAGSSDEDLVFHIRKSEWERPLREQATPGGVPSKDASHPFGRDVENIYR
jgi:hypothetical protein